MTLQYLDISPEMSYGRYTPPPHPLPLLPKGSLGPISRRQFEYICRLFRIECIIYNRYCVAIPGLRYLLQHHNCPIWTQA